VTQSSSYASGKILVEKEGRLTTVTINRPEVRNALDQEAALGLRKAFTEFEADQDQNVAILTGTDGTFCAGADLKEIAQSSDYLAWAGHPDGPTHGVCQKPVIAAIEGHACAGGLGLALWCDIRVGDDTAIFGVFSRRWGVPMSDGTTIRLPRLIGQGRALEMLITGRPVDSREALEWGLLNQCVPAGQARSAALELARKIALVPQIAMRSDRLSAYAQNGRPIDEAIALEMKLAQEAKRLEAQAGAERFAHGAGRHGETDA
jgi:enoyl-CoA hydratase